MFLDTGKWIAAVEARIATEANPVVRRNLEVVRRHMIAERDGNLGDIMQTLSGHPVYKQWGAPESVQPAGREQVQAVYEDFIGTRRGSYLEYDIDRIVADESAVITDGLRRSVFPASVISAPDGYPVSNYPVEDPADLYLVTERQITSWPFDRDGLLTGEEGYRVVRDVRKLTADELAETAAVFASA